MALYLRDLTEQERATIERLAQSRTAPARLVERARFIWYASQKLRVPAIAERVRLNERTVRVWFKRFERDGMAGLNDNPRSGRPITYTGDVVAVVVATALASHKSWDCRSPLGRSTDWNGISMKNAPSLSSAAASTISCLPKACAGDNRVPKVA